MVAVETVVVAVVVAVVLAEAVAAVVVISCYFKKNRNPEFKNISSLFSIFPKIFGGYHYSI